MNREKIALVTGASSGLGIAIADDLARRGYDLVITARSEAALQTQAERIRAAFGVKVLVQPADLSRPDGVKILVDVLSIAPTVVVNNAGFALNEPLVQHAPTRLTDMLQLNIMSLTELTRHYAQQMMAANGGHILLVASLAAYAPTPMLAAYGASKAYVLSLGAALHVELAPKVGVTVLSPGYMETGFDAAAGFQPNAATRRTALDPAQVARIGLDALFKGKLSVVAGKTNSFSATLTRLLPRRFLARQVLKSMDGRFDVP